MVIVVCDGIGINPMPSHQPLKTDSKNALLLALIAGLGLMLAGDLTAQTFTTLHHFTGTGTGPFGAPVISADGAYPYDSLVLVGNTLYGTAFSGGTNGTGTLFAINTDGSGFTNLHSLRPPIPLATTPKESSRSPV